MMRQIITVITPTGDRPLAFALCQNWIRKQTLQPDQWIVVDDGKIPLNPTILMQYVRRDPQPDDPKYTLLLNLKKAIPLIKNNEIIIMEDDEYYAPEYIEEMAHRLNQHEVTGIGKSRYYHLPSGGYFRIKNMTHASLAQTAFRSSFLPDFQELLENSDVYLDFNIWTKANKDGRGFIFVDSNDSPLYVGIKGLPGRTGIGKGHDPMLYRKYPHDITREALKRWIPKDYGIYMDILKGKLTKENCQSWLKM